MTNPPEAQKAGLGGRTTPGMTLKGGFFSVMCLTFARLVSCQNLPPRDGDRCSHSTGYRMRVSWRPGCIEAYVMKETVCTETQMVQ